MISNYFRRRLHFHSFKYPCLWEKEGYLQSGFYSLDSQSRLRAVPLSSLVRRARSEKQWRAENGRAKTVFSIASHSTDLAVKEGLLVVYNQGNIEPYSQGNIEPYSQGNTETYSQGNIEPYSQGNTEPYSQAGFGLLLGQNRKE